MLMVIFGAGASYDSSPDYAAGKTTSQKAVDARPPLADQLFEERFADVMGRFPDCLSIITKLRNRDSEESVEQVLERLRAQSTKDRVSYREITAVQYYLQQMIWDCEHRWEKVHQGVTNYRNLLRDIRLSNKESGPVCFVTFNYDTMLEKAMPTFDATIETIEDYINSQRHKIFKVHGSVDWGRIINRPPFEVSTINNEDITKEIIRQAQYIVEGGGVTTEYVKIPDPFTQKVEDYVLFPALAIPVEGKLDFELPPGHLDQLKKCIPEITKLLLIGWRATDAPFLELLKYAPREMLVHIVCEDKRNADEVSIRMQEAGVKAGGFFGDYSGFTDFILADKAKEFLLQFKAAAPAE